MPQSLFTSQTPAVTNADNGNAIHLGTYFTPSENGVITKYRYYPPTTSQSDVKMALYRVSDSSKLGADVTFGSSIAGPGWVEINAAAPVAVVAGVQYAVVVRVPQYYTATTGVSSPWPFTNDKLSAPANAGRFNDDDNTTVQMVATVFNNGCYFVDVVYTPDSEGGGSTTPVTSILTARWRIYSKVTSTLTSRWRIYSQITSSLTGRWRILGGVVSTLTARWRVYEQVTSILRGRWRVEGPEEPAPEIDAQYLAMQRSLTQMYIANDPTTIELQPYSQVKTPSGGWSWQAGDLREPQTVKMILLSNDQRPTVTVAGVERVIDYHLMGRHDMQIAVGDIWAADDGTMWEVLGFTEGWGYMTKAFVGRHVPRSVRP